MKTNVKSVAELVRVRGQRDAIQNEISTLRSRLEGRRGEHDMIAADLPIEDEMAEVFLEGLAKLGQLQILIGLLPVRIEARERALATANEQLQSAAEACVLELSPFLRDIENRTRINVREQLKAHVTDPAALDRAVADSNRVRTAQALQRGVRLNSNPTEGLDAYVVRLVEAFEEAQEFATTL